MRIGIRRAYDQPADDDGYRVLVDRLWPRGVRKDALAYDLWAKDVAPTDGLRTWWNHRPEDFAEFARRYRAQLKDSDALAALVEDLRGRPAVTLLYSARDTEHNQAVVLAEVLSERLGDGPGAS